MVRTLNDARTAGTMSFAAGGRRMMVVVVVVVLMPRNQRKIYCWQQSQLHFTHSQ